ncbi:zinc finger SWIM domain-containing protein 7-like isoform X4 [Iris pallida]|uniref:Zinc finger SWIM domain-containing protein 7-like isoform X4 n=1 Tax=Iris pallida TaxID=29817 RepID=A0AAX6HNZ5_IRIPA|nr:zinc finger SWIM domain-containing protein 7-like isoform X4 [Iris pallida]KAJ6842035.1 zinc finger SWIM domain-containing protein 7-like isoform X4 [Iris pallida]
MKLVKPIELFQRLKASPGLLLGLDVGTKYVGFAVSDADNKVALPKSVLVRTKSNINFMAEDFQLLVSKYSLVGFVVGFPFSVLGQSSVEAMQVRLFIEDLRRTGKLEGISYTYWSESYSSLCVEAFLQSIKLPPPTYKTIVDKFAAVGILQEYLDHMDREFKLRDAPKSDEWAKEQFVDLDEA